MAPSREAALRILIDALNGAVRRMNASLDGISDTLRRTRGDLDKRLGHDPGGAYLSTHEDAICALNDAALVRKLAGVVLAKIAECLSELDRLNEKVSGLEMRIVRIETLMESASGRAGPVPRLEGS
jgi:hypothetical protein